MISPNVEFAKEVFLTTKNVEVSLKNATTKNVMLLLKSIFYFEGQDYLKQILKDAEKDKRVVHLYVRCRQKSLDTFSNGKTKMVVKEVSREMWDRDEDNGYWIVLYLK